MNTSSTAGRRSFLKGAGAVSIVAAGGLVWRMVDQGVFSTGQGPAYEPWTSWRSDPAEGALSLVRAAILAASPHNTQPWRFTLSESRIDLFADTTRNIGAIDPDLREMYVGLGCALENLLLAASATAYACRLTLLPNPADPTHVAGIELSKGASVASDLYEAIGLRRTNRGAYDLGRTLAPELLKQAQELEKEFADVRIFWFTTAQQREQIGARIIQATQAVIADRQQSQDSARWERLSWQEVQQHRDGITLDAQGLSTFIRSAAKVLPPFSAEQNNEVWLKNTRDTYVGSTNTFGIIAVRSNRDRAQRLLGGRLWQRLHLWGTVQGLGLQPLNQMSERADREVQLGIPPVFGDALGELVSDPGWQALMPFRIGYPLGVALASPRRAIEDVVPPGGSRAVVGAA